MLIIQYLKLHVLMTGRPLCLTPELVYMRRRAQRARVWAVVKFFFFFQFFFIVIIVYFPSLVTVGISAPFFRLDLLSFPITNGLMEG